LSSFVSNNIEFCKHCKDYTRIQFKSKRIQSKVLVGLVPTTRRWCAILLLARVTSLRRRTTLRWSLLLTVLGTRGRRAILTLSLRRLTVLSAWRRRAVLALTLRRLTVLARRGSTVLLALGRCAVLALRRRAVLALRRCTAVLTTRRSSVAAGCGVTLFVLGVVASVNGTEEELDNP
jgi:hypothetical protein